MALVKGNGVIVQALIGGEYKPFACAQEITLSEETDLVEATTATSTLAREYKTLFYSWRLSFAGVFFLQSEGKIVAMDLFTEDIRRNGLTIKATFTATDGATQEFRGSVLVPAKSITLTAGQIAKWAFDMQGTGNYELDEVIPGSVLGTEGYFDYTLDFALTA